MKTKFLNLALFFSFILPLPAFADKLDNSISVSTIENSCAPTDGHAIYFGFKDFKNPHKTINISIWNWRSIMPSYQTDFDFSKNKANRNIVWKRMINIFIKCQFIFDF